MTTLLQRGATWLAGELKTAAGRTVTYQRGGQSVSLVGTPQKLDYAVDDNDGIPRAVTFYDWTFTASELLFNESEVIETRPGDQITETLAGYDITYEAMPPTARPVAEWMDSSNVMRIVHSKIVSLCLTQS